MHCDKYMKLYLQKVTLIFCVPALMVPVHKISFESHKYLATHTVMQHFHHLEFNKRKLLPAVIHSNIYTKYYLHYVLLSLNIR